MMRNPKYDNAFKGLKLTEDEYKTLIKFADNTDKSLPFERLELIKGLTDREARVLKHNVRFDTLPASVWSDN